MRTITHVVTIAAFLSMPSCKSSSSTQTPPPTTESPAAAEPAHHPDLPDRSCPAGFECSADQACRGDDCLDLRRIGWIDTDDAGDDPFVPGCHWFHDDPTCSTQRFFHGGDSCIDETHLHEYTDPECHFAPPNDEVDYDCDQLCKDQGSSGGFCTVVDGVCDVGAPTNAPSAACQCQLT